MQEFKVNDFITLKLEGKNTVIYVAGERFQQCKHLLINIPIDEITAFDQIQSIDEVAEKFKITLETSPMISPEARFWAHCSNLQVWVEHTYDTRLLHSNLAFPLLKKLAEVGDIEALRVFKEEIAARIESGYEPVIKFLWNEGYMKYLSKEELSTVLPPKYEELNFLFDIVNSINVKFYWAKDRLDADEEGPAWFSMKDYKVVEFEISHVPKLDKFPESITKLKSLLDVRMIEDSIKFVPESIGNLTQLQYLDLTGNKVEEIPHSIGNCKKLEVLKLRSNRIKILPKSIGNLILLKELDLTNNSLINLNESIGNLSMLKELYVGNNKITQIPKKIQYLHSLEHIDVMNNKIVKIPEFISNIKSLKSLLINGNRLNYITENLSIIDQIKSLQIDKKQLNQFRKLFQKLENKKIKIYIV
ncbi:MAG: leucine-rich repeat domain-containing protein [Candidatus Odinarchaeota archaeon]